MNAAQFVHQQIAEARSPSNAAMAGVTDEQFNWLPPGTINPIKSTLLHATGGEDFFFQLIIQGQARLWATAGWAGKIGLAQTPGGGQGWEEAKRTVLALAPLLTYAEAVCSATNEYLARLTDDELDR